MRSSAKTPRRKRVLIVDDDAAVANMLTEYFRESSDVEIELNGADALMAVQLQRPDFVILDVNMPGLNGVEVLRRIKAMDSSILVIMLTASTDLKVAEEILKLGAFAYFPKPVNFQYLAHLVGSL